MSWKRGDSISVGPDGHIKLGKRELGEGSAVAILKDAELGTYRPRYLEQPRESLTPLRGGSVSNRAAGRIVGARGWIARR